MTVLDDTDCDEAYGVEFDNETMICAKGFGVDTCQGDSGEIISFENADIKLQILVKKFKKFKGKRFFS